MKPLHIRSCWPCQPQPEIDSKHEKERKIGTTGGQQPFGNKLKVVFSWANNNNETWRKLTTWIISICYYLISLITSQWRRVQASAAAAAGSSSSSGKPNVQPFIRWSNRPIVCFCKHKKPKVERRKLARLQNRKKHFRNSSMDGFFLIGSWIPITSFPILSTKHVMKMGGNLRHTHTHTACELFREIGTGFPAKMDSF